MSEEIDKKNKPQELFPDPKKEGYAPHTANVENFFRNPHWVSLTIAGMAIYLYGIPYLQWIIAMTDGMPNNDLRSYIRFGGLLIGAAGALAVPYFLTNFVVWIFNRKK